MHRARRIIVLLFAAAYVAALGLPWNLMLDGAPESTRPWLAGGTPMLNVATLWLICGLAASLRRLSDKPGASRLWT